MKKVRGFSLVELLVVISIIGILAGVLLPVAAHWREEAVLHIQKTETDRDDVRALILEGLRTYAGLTPKLKEVVLSMVRIVLDDESTEEEVRMAVNTLEDVLF